MTLYSNLGDEHFNRTVSKKMIEIDDLNTLHPAGLAFNQDRTGRLLVAASGISETEIVTQSVETYQKTDASNPMSNMDPDAPNSVYLDPGGEKGSHLTLENRHSTLPIECRTTMTNEITIH
jgi:hypothetical protein